MDSLATLFPMELRDGSLHRGARRCGPRYALHASVEVLSPGHASGMVLNVSARGLRITLDRSPPVDSQCVLKIRLHDGVERIEHARIVWVRPQVDGVVLGLELTADSPA
jgi:hypothetical protein